MTSECLIEEITSYDRWKQQLIQYADAYRTWMGEHGIGTPEDAMRISAASDTLRRDRVTLAFVAEVSRGKSELINSLFFADYKRRLLPSQAGRTTMCPTELFYDDHADAAYVRLLPIETRLDDESLAEYKNSPQKWKTVTIDPDSTDSVLEAFAEVTRTKRVSVERAEQLGLYDADHHQHLVQHDAIPGEIEIPYWRHALISFPHPLLRHGLVVLDTPGLNALGSEPELTLNMIPNAQAILFVVGADTGVTRSDLEMWQSQLARSDGDGAKHSLVVLNKIDSLWDELNDAETINRSIAGQRRLTADTLHVPLQNVFPVSAQKALLAKVKGNMPLLRRSGLPALEQALSADVLPNKQRLLSDHFRNELNSIMSAHRTLLDTQLAAERDQQLELQAVSDKNDAIIEHLLKKTREEQRIYSRNVERLQISRKLLAQHTHELLGLLDTAAIDRLIGQTRKRMSGSWTTLGLKNAMKRFFDRVHETLDEAGNEAREIHSLVLNAYEAFRGQPGFGDIHPELFSTAPYSAQFDRLYEEAEAFRKSPVTSLTEQSFVVKKFFISLVSHARNILSHAEQDATRWANSVMTPVISQFKQNKANIEERLDTLRRISESRVTVQQKIAELESACRTVETQLSALNMMQELINRPVGQHSAAPTLEVLTGGMAS